MPSPDSESEKQSSGFISTCARNCATFLRRELRRKVSKQLGSSRNTGGDSHEPNMDSRKSSTATGIDEKYVEGRSQRLRNHEIGNRIDDKDPQAKVLRKYEALIQTRRELVERETHNSWDRKVRWASTPIERRAARIVHKIREFERAAPGGPFGNVASEDVPSEETRDMGGQFLTNKDRIDTRSKLFDIAKAMPKGGLLHLHLNAQLLPGQVLDYANDKVPDKLFIASNKILDSEEAFRVSEIQVAVLEFSEEDEKLDPDLFTKNFTCFKGTKPAIGDRMQWMRWSSFRAKFKHAFEKVLKCPTLEDGAHCKWVKEKLVLSPEEVYGYHQTVNGIWARFNQSTRAFKGFLNFESAFRWYIGAAIDEMVEDGIMYAEMRPMWLDKRIPSDEVRNKTLSHLDQIEILESVLEEKKKEFPFGLKIIYCTPRSIPQNMMWTEIKDCLELHRKKPEIMCGFDLVGAEDRPNHVGTYLKQLFTMQEICETEKLNIPFMFHAGETLIDRGGSFNTANSNLYDSAALKAKRIGHGFALPKHPELMKEFAAKNICIELCPISNELLHLCRNVKEHPFPQLLEAGIPCSLNSDNPSLFSSSLSHEFYQVMVGWPRMTLLGWKQLAIWSIEYSCLDESRRNDALKVFFDRWERYCHWIVEDYRKHVYELKTEGETRKVDIKEFKTIPKHDEYDNTIDDELNLLALPELYRQVVKNIQDQMPYELTSESYEERPRDSWTR